MDMHLENVHNAIAGSTVTAGGDVLVGGTKVTNLFYSAQYQDLKRQQDDLTVRFNKTRSRLEKYPDEAEDFKSDLLQIDTERQVVQRKIDDLRREVIRLAEDFQKIPLNTERLRLAKQHFEAGNFPAARAVLDTEAMGHELDALLSEKEGLESRQVENEAHLLDKANEFLILARLTSTNYDLPDWFEKAKDYFEQSLRSSRTRENLFDYAVFLQNHNQMGADVLYEELIIIIKQLMKDNPEQFELDLAGITMNLGLLYYNFHKESEAEKMYLYSLEIYERLAKINPIQFENGLAKILECLASFYSDLQKMSESENLYLRSLGIKERLAKHDPAQFESELASITMNLGIFYTAYKKIPVAEKMYLCSLEIYERLIKKNPVEFEPELAIVAMNLGTFYKATKNMPEAEKMFLRSLNLYKEWVKNNPARFEPELAKTLMNLGIFYGFVDRMSEAEKMCLDSLEIYERLAQNNPARFEPELANTLGSLSFFYLFSNKYLLAAATAKKAIILAPAQNWMLNNIAHAYLLRNDWPKAKIIYTQYIDGENDIAAAKTIISEDWNKLEAAGITCAEMVQARAWLQEEQR